MENTLEYIQEPQEISQEEQRSMLLDYLSSGEVQKDKDKLKLTMEVARLNYQINLKNSLDSKANRKFVCL